MGGRAAWAPAKELWETRASAGLQRRLHVSGPRSVTRRQLSSGHRHRRPPLSAGWVGEAQKTCAQERNKTSIRKSAQGLRSLLGEGAGDDSRQAVSLARAQSHPGSLLGRDGIELGKTGETPAGGDGRGPSPGLRLLLAQGPAGPLAPHPRRGQGCHLWCGRCVDLPAPGREFASSPRAPPQQGGGGLCHAWSVVRAQVRQLLPEAHQARAGHRHPA